MLIDTRGWEPDPPERRRLPHIPWQPFAWVWGFVFLLALALEIGGFPGYLVVLLAVALGSWRLGKWADGLTYGRAGDSGAWR